MRVVTGSIFAIFWACVHADIASLNKFKESYATHLLTHLPSDANAAIMGVALPSEAEADLQPLWRWYRTVDASTKGLAKQVMDEAQSSQPLANSAVALADFKKLFDADLKAFPAGAIADLEAANAAAKWPLVAAVLGETEPTGDGKKAWKAYRALGADSQPPAKEMMEGEFLTLFKTQWATAFPSATTYKAQMTLRANSISLQTPELKQFFDSSAALVTKEGKETSQIYRAVSESMRERLSRIMG